MGRKQSEKRSKAFSIYDEHHGKIKNKEIAKEIGVSAAQISRWKKEDEWDFNLSSKRGAPYGNSNANGNRGGAPSRNKNAEKHGFYSKFFPEETREIMEQISDDNILDNLWESIVIQKAVIIRAQHIMFVKDKDDTSRELKKSKEFISENSSSTEEEYEIQMAWDRHATMMNAQSRAFSTLNNMIKQYDELLSRGFGSEHQLLRMEKLKAEISTIKDKTTNIQDLDINIVVDYGDEDENG